MDLNAQNSGLLHKIELMSKINNNRHSFFDFIKSNRIEIFAEFYFYSDLFFCKQSYGLDGSSILLSNSTKSFWDGLTPVLGKIYNFSKEDNSLTPLLQFFSFEIKEKIKTISICRTSEDSLIFICNKPLTTLLVQSFESINSKNYSDIQSNFAGGIKNYMLSLDFSESLEDYKNINLPANNDVEDLFENALLKELFNRLTFYFQSPSAVTKSSKAAANVIFATKSVFVPELLHKHLISILKDVLEDSSDLIGFNFLGQAHSVTAAKEFLKVI